MLVDSIGVWIMRGCWFTDSLFARMEAMLTEFSSRFALTNAEQEGVVIDSITVIGIRTKRFLLVGKLLTDKPYNKEALRRTLYSIWRPKTKVTIVDIGYQKIDCAFNSKDECDTVLRGDPWLFNGYLMVLAKADGITNPKHIPLLRQDFWVQVKRLPLGYMTRTMGKIIGDVLGGYVVTDQSKKKLEKLESYLRIWATLNIS